MLHGLGSLEPAKAWRLFTRGWIFYGKLKVQPGRLVAALLLPSAALAVIAWGGHAAHAHLARPSQIHRPFTLSADVTRGVQVTILKWEK